MKKLTIILSMAFAILVVSCDDKSTDPTDDNNNGGNDTPTYVADLAFDIPKCDTLLPTTGVKVVNGGFTATLTAAAVDNAATLTELMNILEAYRIAFDAKKDATTSLAKIDIVNADLSSSSNMKTITVKITFADNSGTDIIDKYTAIIVLNTYSTDTFNVIFNSAVDVTIENPTTPRGVTYTGGPITIVNNAVTSAKLTATVDAATDVTYSSITVALQNKLQSDVDITAVIAIASTVESDEIGNVTGTKDVTLIITLLSETHVFEGNGFDVKEIAVVVSFVKEVAP